MRITEADAGSIPAITAIYNDAVEHTTAIWNDRTVDEADRAAWVADHERAGFPVLVAVDDDEVVGYATFGPWRPHDGYRYTVEHSVYVRGDQRGRGLGRTLMVELIERARALGLHAMVAGIASDNVGSIRLHEKLGFRTVGVLPQVGTKFGTWLDLTFLQLTLDDRERPEDADRGEKR